GRARGGTRTSMRPRPGPAPRGRERDRRHALELNDDERRARRDLAAGEGGEEGGVHPGRGAGDVADEDAVDGRPEGRRRREVGDVTAAPAGDGEADRVRGRAEGARGDLGGTGAAAVPTVLIARRVTRRGRAVGAGRAVRPRGA